MYIHVVILFEIKIRKKKKHCEKIIVTFLPLKDKVF